MKMKDEEKLYKVNNKLLDHNYLAIAKPFYLHAPSQTNSPTLLYLFYFRVCTNIIVISEEELPIVYLCY